MRFGLSNWNGYCGANYDRLADKLRVMPLALAGDGPRAALVFVRSIRTITAMSSRHAPPPRCALGQPLRAVRQARRFVALVALTLLLAPALARAGLDPCLESLACAHRQAAVAMLDGWSVGALGPLLEEYAFRHAWLAHRDAIAAGFAVGDRVNGDRLAPDRVFDPAAVARWREEYAQQRRARFLQRSGGSLDARALAPAIVLALSGGCLGSGGWGAVRLTSQCEFTFRAGYRGEGRSLAAITPMRLEAAGARCTAWPAGTLRASGASVTCVRSGTKPAIVRLMMRDGPAIERPLPVRGQTAVPPEPHRETKRSGPKFESMSLYHSRDYRVIERSERCPGCDLYAADFGPSVAGATILGVGFVSGSVRDGWQRCPAAMLCAAPEFSPPDRRNVTGCAGWSAVVSGGWRATRSRATTPSRSAMKWSRRRAGTARPGSRTKTRDDNGSRPLPPHRRPAPNLSTYRRRCSAPTATGDERG